MVEILHIDQNTLLKKNDAAEKRREEMLLKNHDRSADDVYIPDSDQLLQSDSTANEVSQFKTSVNVSSNIGQEAGIQDSEGIIKEDVGVKKVVNRNSTGQFHATHISVKKGQAHTTRQTNIIGRPSHPFNSTISSGAGSSKGAVSQTNIGTKGSYQSTGTPSKMKIFAQNSSGSNQNLPGGRKDNSKIMIHKDKGQGKMSVVKKAKINLEGVDRDSCNVSTHSNRESHGHLPIGQIIDKKVSYASTSSNQNSPGQKLAGKKKSKDEDANFSNMIDTHQPKGDLEAGGGQKLKVSISKLQSKQLQKTQQKQSETGGKMSK